MNLLMRLEHIQAQPNFQHRLGHPSMDILRSRLVSLPIILRSLNIVLYRKRSIVLDYLISLPCLGVDFVLMQLYSNMLHIFLQKLTKLSLISSPEFGSWTHLINPTSCHQFSNLLSKQMLCLVYDSFLQVLAFIQEVLNLSDFDMPDFLI